MVCERNRKAKHAVKYMANLSFVGYFYYPFFQNNYSVFLLVITIIPHVHMCISFSFLSKQVFSSLVGYRVFFNICVIKPMSIIGQYIDNQAVDFREAFHKGPPQIGVYISSHLKQPVSNFRGNVIRNPLKSETICFK